MTNIQKYPNISFFSKNKEAYKFNTDGYFIKKNVLKKNQISQAKQLIKKYLIEDQNLYGAKFLKNKGEIGQIRSLILRNKWFEIFCNSKFVNKILNDYLSDKSILHLINGIVTSPNIKHNQASFHRDFPKSFICSKPLSINIFYALTKFDGKTGGTWVVPGSHKIESFPKSETIDSNKIQINCNAGDALIFDSMLVHGSGKNYTKSKRFAINTQFTYPFIKQQIDLPEMYKNIKFKLTKKVEQRIGCWTIPPKSIDEFRHGVNGKRTYRSGQG